jgi:hypothetical protein
MELEQEIQSLRTALDICETRLEFVEMENHQLMMNDLNEKSLLNEKYIANVNSEKETAVALDEFQRMHRLEKGSWTEREKAYQTEIKSIQSELRGVKAKV